jgi:hypothetical protein
MSNARVNSTRALRIIPSNNSNIPFPNAIDSGIYTSRLESSLVDSTGFFITNNVAIGDIVYNTTDGTTATITGVVSETEVTLNADIFTATPKAYTIYQASSLTGSGNAGCLLYVGGSGNVVVTTIGQDDVTFSGVVAGTILPVQVIAVKSAASGTTATLINALW